MAKPNNQVTDMVTQYRIARSVAVPLIAVNTPDQPATAKALAKVESDKAYVINWDFSRGATSLSKPATALLNTLFPNNSVKQRTVGNMPELVNQLCDTLLTQFNSSGEPEFPDVVVICHNMHKFLDSPAVVQTLCNARDVAAAAGAAIVLLAPDFTLPSELSSDILSIDEPLPNKAQLATYVKEIHNDALGKEPTQTTLDESVKAINGLAAFPSKQAVAMSAARGRLDPEELWFRKAQMIRDSGMEMWQGGEVFTDIGGYDNCKNFTTKQANGRAPFNAVLWLDEGEKFFAGSTEGTSDMSGVSQKNLGIWLEWMENSKARGFMFLGAGGTGKSLMSKAIGNEFGLPTMMLGQTESSLVGESQRLIKSKLKTVDAISNGQGGCLVVMTCNKAMALPPELKRRFSIQFYFDLPTADELAAIWPIYQAKYNFTDEQVAPNNLPNYIGWTGAEIRNCCDIAWQLDISLVEAAEYIVPISKSNAQSIADLRNQANGVFISASYSGTYDITRNTVEGALAGRRFKLPANPNNN